MTRRDEFLRGLETAGGWPDGEPDDVPAEIERLTARERDLLNQIRLLTAINADLTASRDADCIFDLDNWGTP